MTHAVLLCGAPASGKSTYAELLKRRGYAVHSRDEVRRRLRKKNTSTSEDAIWRTFMTEFIADLLSGKSAVADATFSNWRRRDEAIAELKRLAVIVTVELHYLRVPLEVCITRNQGRSNIERIPDEDVKRLHKDVEAAMRGHRPDCLVRVISTRP